MEKKQKKYQVFQNQKMLNGQEQKNQMNVI